MLRSLVGSEMCIRDRSTQSTGSEDRFEWNRQSSRPEPEPMDTPSRVSAPILRRMQDASSSRFVQGVMHSMRKARSIIDTEPRRLSTASQLAKELELHKDTPQRQSSRAISRAGAVMVQTHQRSNLSVAMSIWMVRAWARRKWRQDSTETQSLLSLQGAVLKDLERKMADLQGLLRHLKVGNAQALKALLPGVRDASWVALLEEVEALVLVFESKMDALSEGNRVIHSSLSAEHQGASVVIKRVSPASGDKVALLKLLCRSELSQQSVHRSVLQWRLSARIGLDHWALTASTQLTRSFNDWRTGRLLARQRAQRRKEQMDVATERAEHAKELAALHSRIAVLESRVGNSQTPSPPSRSLSKGREILAESCAKSSVLSRKLDNLRNRFEEIEDVDTPAPAAVRSPMLSQSMNTSQHNRNGTPQKKKGALLRALKERFNQA
eukprot:TRINITY_DN2259_c0_g1_i1.p1 TRINITY_DN2259_c0_g1~~TRINITY_DN2259_c0_g1_i1.p1  ORF type:complete len:439 (-),score=75.96 TRINITY_DN2259_c0_g1_i1:329-1645(-)